MLPILDDYILPYPNLSLANSYVYPLEIYIQRDECTQTKGLKWRIQQKVLNEDGILRSYVNLKVKDRWQKTQQRLPCYIW